MDNFIITGSQRSGTTLLKLILDSHSNITVFDEDEVGFHGENIASFTEIQNNICGFKLPMVSNDIELLKKNNSKIIFIVRDPRDVVFSMLSLQLKYNLGYDKKERFDSFDYLKIIRKFISNRVFLKFILLFLRIKKQCNLPWIYHPAGIEEELNFSFFDENLKHVKDNYIKTHPLNRKKDKALEIAAHVWNYKNLAPALYEEENLDYICIRYENLISDTENTVKEICSFIDISFESNMLNYYKNKKGVSIGNTKNDQPVMAKNTNKWLNYFSEKEINLINNICKKTADKFGYSLNTSDE